MLHTLIVSKHMLPDEEEFKLAQQTKVMSVSEPSSDMGRLLHGFSASPSLGTQVTSVSFHARANVLDLKELFIRDAIMCKVAGKLS